MKRRYYADYLKALGCITIIATHVIVEGIYKAETELDYCILKCIQVLTRWAVPVFVMVSGCNLLGRDNDYAVAKKHIRKMLIVTCIWGIIHVLATPLIDLLLGKEINFLTYSFDPIFDGPAYHLWFCFMILGLYMLIPIIDPIIQEKRRCEYFILICLFGEIILPTAIILGEFVPPIATIVKHLRFPEFGLYLVYFVLGYYIDRYAEFAKRIRMSVYGLALLSLGILVIWEYMSIIQITPAFSGTVWNDILLINFVIGIFVFFKFDFKVGKCYPIIRRISEASFGIFLMHFYLCIRLSWKGIHASMFNPLLATPFVTLLVFAMCYLACRIIQKIPFLGKWLF